MTVVLHVRLRGFLRVMHSVRMMSARGVRMVSCLLVIAGGMVLGGFRVVMGRMTVMLGCFLMVLSCFFRHSFLLN
jgi:hypothetical protein